MHLTLVRVAPGFPICRSGDPFFLLSKIFLVLSTLHALLLSERHRRPHQPPMSLGQGITPSPPLILYPVDFLFSIICFNYVPIDGDWFIFTNRHTASPFLYLQLCFHKLC